MLQHSLISLKDYNETWVSISNQYWFASAQATPCTNIKLCSSCKQNLPNRFVLPELLRLSSENKTLFLPISEDFFPTFSGHTGPRYREKKKPLLTSSWAVLRRAMRIPWKQETLLCTAHVRTEGSKLSRYSQIGGSSLSAGGGTGQKSTGSSQSPHKSAQLHSS